MPAARVFRRAKFFLEITIFGRPSDALPFPIAQTASPVVRAFVAAIERTTLETALERERAGAVLQIETLPALEVRLRQKSLKFHVSLALFAVLGAFKLAPIDALKIA